MSSKLSHQPRPLEVGAQIICIPGLYVWRYWATGLERYFKCCVWHCGRVHFNLTFFAASTCARNTKGNSFNRAYAFHQSSHCGQLPSGTLNTSDLTYFILSMWRHGGFWNISDLGILSLELFAWLGRNCTCPPGKHHRTWISCMDWIQSSTIINSAGRLDKLCKNNPPLPKQRHGRAWLAHQSPCREVALKATVVVVTTLHNHTLQSAPRYPQTSTWWCRAEVVGISCS